MIINTNSAHSKLISANNCPGSTVREVVRYVAPFQGLVCLGEERVPFLCWVLKSEHHRFSAVCVGMGKAPTTSSRTFNAGTVISKELRTSMVLIDPAERELDKGSCLGGVQSPVTNLCSFNPSNVSLCFT